jgi:predicted RNA-binding Zn ribbon-like protein
MILNAYKNQKAILVEALINTYDLYLDEPEHLRNPADLAHFLKAHHIEVAEQVTHQTLEQVRQLRTQLRNCWSANTFEEMALGLNPLLGQTSIIVQVEPYENDLSIRFDLPSTASLLQRLTVECARGIIAVAHHYGIDRMRSCTAEPCRDVFVDTSRNKSRRFCSDRCANRYNIAAFRDRQKNSDLD